jgi:hypothetical protein
MRSSTSPLSRLIAWAYTFFTPPVPSLPARCLLGAAPLGAPLLPLPLLPLPAADLCAQYVLPARTADDLFARGVPRFCVQADCLSLHLFPPTRPRGGQVRRRPALSRWRTALQQLGAPPAHLLETGRALSRPTPSPPPTHTHIQPL